MAETLSLGLDVGSVNAKLVVVDGDGAIVYWSTQQLISSPRATVVAMLDALEGQLPLSAIGSAATCGQCNGLIPAQLQWASFSTSLGLARGVLESMPNARTIIQVGGQSSLVVRLEEGLSKPWQVDTNPLCAAGTGRFLEQQAYRLGIAMDQFAEMALACRVRPPRIAARCSVFAKSDLIHLQQKGVTVDAMLRALCESVARMVASITSARLEQPIVLTGGMAANRAFVRALEEALVPKTDEPVQINVPDDFLYVGAYGAALLARGRQARVTQLLPSVSTNHHVLLPPLRADGDGDEAGRARTPSPGAASGAGREPECDGAAGVYLGVDVGSTSTKAVVIGADGRSVLGKAYLMTAGRPIDAVKEVFRQLLEAGLGRFPVQGAGVTGSGRYLIGSLIGADLVKNEITAQARAAAQNRS